ncbi:MAG: SHOCT domain-containing protein [Dehalococcoidales bacterium]
MIIFWLVIVGLIIWGGSALTRRENSSSRNVHRSDALEIVRERYAKGEISKEEHDEIRKNLS